MKMRVEIIIGGLGILFLPSPAMAEDERRTLSCSASGTEINTNGFGESRTRDRSEDFTVTIDGREVFLETQSGNFVDLETEATSYRADDVRGLSNGGEITYTYVINRSTGRFTVVMRMTRQPPVRGSWDFRWDASGTCELNTPPRF